MKNIFQLIHEEWALLKASWEADQKIKYEALHRAELEAKEKTFQAHMQEEKARIEAKKLVIAAYAQLQQAEKEAQARKENG